jgi:hypothetical protein
MATSEDDNFADSPVHPSTFFTEDRTIRFFDNAHFSRPDARMQNATRQQADEAYQRFLSGKIRTASPGSTPPPP